MFLATLFPALMAALLSGCTSPQLLGNQKTHSSVRKVDYSATPELREWAERARKVGDEKYPQIVALLSDDATESPRQFDITFKRHLWRDMAGIALGKTIYLNGSYFTNGTSTPEAFLRNPTNFDKVLVHEMAHIAEQYATLWFYTAAPSYWVEGMADYVRFKLGDTNGWSCPECNTAIPHYTSGYACAGAFLLFVDQRYGSGVIRQFNVALRKLTYSDEFFQEATGQSLDELWTEFQKTPAHLPGAAETYKLRQILGYKDGKAPKNEHARVMAYLNKTDGGKITIQSGDWLNELVKQDKLVGATKKDRAGKRFVLGLHPADILNAESTYPVTRKWFGRFEDGKNNFYIISRASVEAPWQLQRAWRGDEKGNVFEEFSVK